MTLGTNQPALAWWAPKGRHLAGQHRCTCVCPCVCVCMYVWLHLGSGHMCDGN